MTDIDGNKYKVVKIGDQYWMKENLKVTHYRNGDVIPNISDSLQWSKLTMGAYCNYNNDPNNVDTYGRLYNWYAVNDNRNIAPEGWHVANDADLHFLINSLGGRSIAGNKMKTQGTTTKGNGLWFGYNDYATNESGFSALPGGGRGHHSGFARLGKMGIFWSASEFERRFASSYVTLSADSSLIRDRLEKNFGCSVRCVKD